MLEMLINMLITSLDLKINPAEVTAAWERIHAMIPVVAQKVQETDERVKRLEMLLQKLVDENKE